MGWDPGVAAVVRGGCASGLAIRVLGRWNRACDRRKGDRNRSGIGQATGLPPAIPKRWAFFRRPLATVGGLPELAAAAPVRGASFDGDPLSPGVQDVRALAGATGRRPGTSAPVSSRPAWRGWASPPRHLP